MYVIFVCKLKVFGRLDEVKDKSICHKLQLLMEMVMVIFGNGDETINGAYKCGLL